MRRKLILVNGTVLTEGVEYQWVNGQMTIDQGQYTGKLPGKGLRFSK